MLEQLIKQAGQLPPLPEIYIRVNELLSSEDSTGSKIGEALQSDPALTAKILKLINSAFYGLHNPVTSIPQAVSLLGRDQLKQILLGSVMSGVVKELDITNFPLRDFWQHCIKTAIIARQLAMQNAQVIDHEAFFTVGLLHDIGWLVIAKVKPGSFELIHEMARAEVRETLDVETRELGFTHIDVGVALLEKWKMPHSIIQSVNKHHDYEHDGVFSIETSIAYLANRLSRFELNTINNDNIEDDADEENDPLTEVLSTIDNWEASKCTAEQIGIACRLAEEQWLEVMETLGLGDLDIDATDEEEYRFNTSVNS